VGGAQADGRRPVLLSRLVDVSAEVRATRSRSRKVATLAAALEELGPDERDAGVAFLSGEPRQDRLELGPAAVHGLDVAPAAAASLSVAEVDRALQAIADVAAGTGSRTRRLELFHDLLARATDDEQRFLRGLVLRELRQGALAGLLTQAIARAADVDEAAVRRAAMLSGDLRATARAAIEHGADGLAAFRLVIGTPLQPMLAQTAGSVTEAVSQLGEVAIEAKIDGARVQVHRDGDEVAVFTRNLNDVSHRVPEVVAATLALPVRAVVLDGEAIALTPSGRPRPFQETMQRFGRERDLVEARAEVPLSVRFFDVLHLEGDDLLDRPLRGRLEALRTAVPDGTRVDQVVTDDVDEAAAFLRATLQAGHEGVMVKDLDAPYEAGRRGAGWRKVKPVHTLDLVVLAAEWGSGRRRGWLSNLHLGCRADDGDGFVMLGKTFKGLTDEVLTWQTEQLLARETHREGHVVHVRPELVVEIALDGLVRSPRYPGGLAMRFARVRGYRTDKAPHEADTLTTVRALHAGDLPPPT
jgi:DNA ligase 1